MVHSDAVDEDSHRRAVKGGLIPRKQKTFFEELEDLDSILGEANQ